MIFHSFAKTLNFLPLLQSPIIVFISQKSTTLDESSSICLLCTGNNWKWLENIIELVECYIFNSKHLAIFISNNLCHPSIFTPWPHLVLFSSLGTAPLLKYIFYSLISTSSHFPLYVHHSKSSHFIPVYHFPPGLSSFTNLGSCIWSQKKCCSKAHDHVAFQCFWQIHPTKVHLHLFLNNSVESVERERL